MFIKSVIFLIILGFTRTLTVGQPEGAACTAERENLAGKCTKLSECASVIDDIRNRRNHTGCGFQGRTIIVCCPYTHEPEIVGGEVAGRKEFPHMALVGVADVRNKPHWLSTGTLISDRYVLIAAHCINGSQLGEPQIVRLGAFIINSDKDDPEAEDFMIEQIIPHPDWTSASLYNDIGLLKLNRTVNFNPFKKPACLPVQFDVPEKRYVTTGYIKYVGSSSQQLRKVTVEKFSYSECSDIHSENIDRRLLWDGIRNGTQLCAGSKRDQKIKVTCKGYSGRPLQVINHSDDHCMYTIIGIESFFMCDEDYGALEPHFYTRVFPYVDWIKNTTGVL